MIVKDIPARRPFRWVMDLTDLKARKSSPPSTHRPTVAYDPNDGEIVIGMHLLHASGLRHETVVFDACDLAAFIAVCESRRMTRIQQQQQEEEGT